MTNPIYSNWPAVQGALFGDQEPLLEFKQSVEVLEEMMGQEAGVQIRDDFKREFGRALLRKIQYENKHHDGKNRVQE